MPKVDGTPTKGEIKSEELRAMKAELSRMAQALELEREALASERAAASLAEELREARQERQRQREGKAEEPGKMGRPSDYTEALAGHLCRWIAEGKSLNKWCKATGVSASTVYRWMGERPDFSQKYAQAHADRTDTLAEEMLDIADAAQDFTDIAKVQAAKLRIETRKWIASKLKPTKWGDRMVVENTGNVVFQLGIGGKPADEKVLDGKSLIQEAIPAGLSDSQSDRLSQAPRQAVLAMPVDVQDAVPAPSRGRA